MQESQHVERVFGPVGLRRVPLSVLPARWQPWGTSPAANPNLGNHGFAGCPLEGQGWVLVHGMMGWGRVWLPKGRWLQAVTRTFLSQPSSQSVRGSAWFCISISDLLVSFPPLPGLTG